MKKKLSILLCCVAAMFLISGCGKDNKETATAKEEHSAEEFIAHFIYHFSVGDNYGSKTKDFYFEESMEEAMDSFYAISMGPMTAEEYVIVRASDEENAERVAAALETYRVNRISDFEGYAPADAAKLKSAKVVEEGRYVALFVAENSDEINDYFKKCVNEGMELSEEEKNLAEGFESIKMEIIPNDTEVTSETDEPETQVSEAPADDARKPRTKKASDGQKLIEEVKGYIEVYDSSKIVEAYKKNDASILTDEKDIAVLNKAKEIISKNIKDGMTAYEKEKAIHDYIVKETSYDSYALEYSTWFAEYADQPYGCLINNRAICVGYATTFKMFMDMLDVECIIVTGSANDTYDNHGWNMVNLEDGNWYVIDVTWDDPVGPEDGMIFYSYFNVTDDIILDSHHWDRDKYPAATGGKYKDIRFDLMEDYEY